MRNCSITGVLEVSDNPNPCPTARTIDGRFGRGSSSQICDFIAKAWLRSCMMEELSPQYSPTIMRAPAVTPLDARLASASDATLVPTVDLKVAAPRRG